MNPRQEFLTTLFRDLEANGVRYCVMRNYANLYTAHDTDVDLLVSPHSVECFEQCLRAAAAGAGFRFVHEARYTNYSHVYWHPDAGFTRIDFEEDIRWKLCPVLDARTVLDARIRHEEFYVPAPGHESVILFVAAMWRGELSERYRKQLARLHAACKDRTQLCATLTAAFGGCGSSLAEFQAQVMTRDFDRGWVRRLRRSLVLTCFTRGGNFPGLLRNVATDIRRLGTRLRTPAGISLLFVSASPRQRNFEELFRDLEFLFPAQKNSVKMFNLVNDSSACVRLSLGLRWLRLRTLFKGGLFVRAYRVADDTAMPPVVRTHARYLYPSRAFVCLEDRQGHQFFAHVGDGFMAGHAPVPAASSMNFGQSFIEFIAAVLGRKNNVSRAARSPRGVFCALVGLDGAGKTTLARHLCELALAEKRFPGARYFHWQPRLFRSVQFPLPEYRNLPRKPELPRSAFNSLLSVLRLVKNIGLANLTFWLRIRPLLRRGYLVLVDRYFYNYHLDPVSVKYYGPPGLLARAERWFPRPEVVVTLSAPPEVLLQRKQELSETEIRRQAATLAALKFSAPVLAADARRPAAEVAQTVMQRLIEVAK